MMSKPFFIWTMRRTGGTSLTTLLTEMSEYSALQHEPFNLDRRLGYVIEAFREGKENVAIEKMIEEALFDTPVVKHCYVFVPHQIQ